MNTQDSVSLTGKLQISLNGTVVKEVNNMVVTAGKGWIASRMQGVVDGVMSHMAIGTGTVAAAAANTTLGTELFRQGLTTSGGVVAGAVITFASTFAAGDGTGAITEAAVLNASSAGTMLARTVFGVINKGVLDTMTISWAVTIS